MKKSIVVFLLSLISVASFALGGAACRGDTPSSTGGSSPSGSSQSPSQGPSGELVVPEEPAPLTAPNLKDITVYKGDTPSGFYVGDGVLTALTINGVAVDKEEYVINGGWLLFTATAWEDVGSGDLSIVFDFENYDDVTITVTVSDEDLTPSIPGSEMTAKENFELWTANSSSVSLSYAETESAIVVVKSGNVDNTKSKENMVYFNADYLRLAQEYGAACLLFDYCANQTLAQSESAGFRLYATETVQTLTGGFDSFSASEEWQTATVDIEQFFVANGNAQYFGIVVGGAENATLTFKNWRVGTREALNEYRVSTLLPNYGFSEENVSKWSLANPAGLQIGWDDEKGMRLTPQGANAGLWQRDGMAYIPVTFMKIAQSAGYQGVSFTVKADDSFADYTPIPYNPALGKGLRVVSKTVDGRDDNRIIDGMATGIRQYGDFGADGSLEFTVTIAIDAFFALNPDAKYLGVVVAVDAGSSLYLSNLQLIQTIEGGGSGGETPTPERPDKELVEKYGFTQKNSASKNSGGIWEVNAGGIFSFAFDPLKNGMKISMSNANAGLYGRDFVLYTDIAILKDALAAGFTAMRFTLTSDDGAFTGENRTVGSNVVLNGIRIYSKQNAGRNGDGGGIGNANGGTAAAENFGTFVYKDFGTGGGVSEFTVVIDIEEFLALNASVNYLGIVLSMPSGTTAHFSDMTFYQKPQATEADLLAKYGFSLKNNPSTASGGIWDVNAGGTVARSWDADRNAMKLTMANPNAGLDGRDFVTYTDISILKEALKAGFTTFTFKVTSEDGAFAEAERTVGANTVQNGIRVYSKQTPGRNGDAGGIRDTSQAKSYGTYIYKDFGTGGGVSEFTVTIDIAEFLALNENASYFAFVFSAPNGTSIYLSDMHFLREE